MSFFSCLKVNVVLLVIFSQTVILYSQIKSEDKNDYLDADYYFYVQEYDKALEHLHRILPKYPTHGNINYLIGICHILSSDDYSNAYQYMKIAVEDINVDYRPGDLKYSGAPVDALLFYGDVLHSMLLFSEASEAYHKYLKEVSEDELSSQIAKNRIVGLGLSYEAYLRPPSFKVSELGVGFNTSENDYNPVLSAHRDAMLYTSQKGTSNRVMYTTQINGEWTTPVDITRELGSDGSYYTSSLSHDGKMLFLVKDDLTNKDLYFSNYENSFWTKVKPLDKKINSLYNETGASISSDGNTLYFSSDRPGGFGGIDIYYTKLEKGKWSKPINIDSPVNTSFDDDSPLISVSEDTLFFSTNGRETIGKMDIFMTSRGQKGLWEHPINLNVPYNTHGNDYLGHYLVLGSNAYLARKDIDSPGGINLYYIEKLPDEKLQIVEQVEENIKTTPKVLEIDSALIEPVEHEITHVYIDTEGDIVEKENTPISDVQETQSLHTNEKIIEDIAADVTTIEEFDYLNGDQEEPQNLISQGTGVETVDNEQIGRESRNMELEALPLKINDKIVDEKTLIKPILEDAKFTIQLMALIKYSGPVPFEGLNSSEIRISIGEDGFTRYTFGQYTSKFNAQSDLRELFSLGHSNAFIKEIRLISNY